MLVETSPATTSGQEPSRYASAEHASTCGAAPGKCKHSAVKTAVLLRKRGHEREMR